MARDTFYQPVDNPIRYDRLPKRRLQLQFRVRTSRKDRLATYGQLVRYFHAIVVAAAIIAWFRSPLICLAVAAVTEVCFVKWTVDNRDRRWLTLTWPLPAAALVALLGTANRMVLLLVVSTALGWLCWQFGRHWTAYCTATPYPRAATHALRRQWHWHLVIFSLVIPVASIVALATSQRIVFGLIIAAAFLVQMVSAATLPNRRAMLSTVTRAIGSWLTYNPDEQHAPGHLTSPAGPWRYRIAGTAACFLLTTVALFDQSMHLLVPQPTSLASITPPSVPTLAMVSGQIASALFLSLAATLLLPVAMTLPVLMDAASRIRHKITGRQWHDLINDIQNSTNPIERRSIYCGRVAADGMPLLVPRSVFNEHAHFLGGTGGGKTSLGLMPIVEQLLASGNCSVIVIDLKAHTLELLATLYVAARRARRHHGIDIPVKYLTNQLGLPTYTYNPLRQLSWRNFDLLTRTDIMCAALGLVYGSDYGAGYFSSTNAAVLHYLLKSCPEAAQLRQLAELVGPVVASAREHELPRETRKAGNHVQDVLRRLAVLDVLNADSSSGSSPFSIDLRNLFTKPQAVYCHLSSSLAPGASPLIARLIVYMLLSAAGCVEHRHQVYLVIDEFQRMVASNVEYMLQLARSMGVGILLANQSLQDLKTTDDKLIPAVEANSRYREWFGVSSSADRKSVIDSSGETVELFRSTTRTVGEHSSTSVTQQERLVPRLGVDDILLATDHPMRSIVSISRGNDYAQFGGMPFVAEHDYHITREEYERRKDFAWPESEDGMLIARPYRPDDHDGPSTHPAPLPPPSSPPPASPPPSITAEIIGDQ